MSLKYRPEIDGLRTIAVLPVLFFHAGFSWAPGGYVGVDVFFVISGYLITTILLKEAADGGISLWRFYDRRARRILPALFLVIFACIPLAWLTMLPSQMEDFAQSVLAVLFFASNIFFWREDDYFGARAEEMPLLHTWSLAVEEQFYVFFPLLIMLVFWVSHRHVLHVLVAATVSSFALAVWTQGHPDISDAAVFYLLPTRAWELGIGAICAYILLHHSPKSRDLFAATGLLMILLSITFFDKNTPAPSAYTLLPTVGAALIILFAGKDGTTHWFLALPPMVWIGLISYSLYLWHQPLFAFARIAIYGDPTIWHFWGLIVLSGLLAYLSWRYVETPARNRGLLPGRALIVSLSSIFACFVVLAASEWAFGLKERVVFSDPRFSAVEWAEKAETSQTCMSHASKMLPLDALCQYGNGAEIIAVLGNSHAQGFAPRLHKHLSSLDLSVRDYTASACQLNYGEDRTQKRRRCVMWSKDVANDILTRADVSTVVIAFRSERADEDGKASIEDFSKAAVNAGKHVIFVKQAPTLVEDVEYYAYNRLGPDMIAPARTLSDWRDIYSEVRDMAQSLKTFATVVEVNDIFCDRAICYAFRDGVALYSDDDHMSMQAADLVTARIAEAVKADRVN